MVKDLQAENVDLRCTRVIAVACLMHRGDMELMSSGYSGGWDENPHKGPVGKQTEFGADNSRHNNTIPRWQAWTSSNV